MALCCGLWGWPPRGFCHWLLDPGMLWPVHCFLAGPDDLCLHRSCSINQVQILPQSIWGFLVPGAQKILLEPSVHLSWLWGLILNVILPFLPSCWVFSFASYMNYLSWWGPAFSCLWSFSSSLHFWSSCRRKWVTVLLLCHLLSLTGPHW